MNEVEQSIYNDGEKIGNVVEHDKSGNTVTHEFIKLEREIFEFSFLNGEFIYIMNVTGVF